MRRFRIVDPWRCRRQGDAQDAPAARARASMLAASRIQV
jgi:hypothetical protein